MGQKKRFDIDCVWNASTQLGEGVVWVESEASVYFVDVIGKKIFRYNLETQSKTEWTTPKDPTFIFPTTQKLFLCGMEDGLYWFDTQRGTFFYWLSVEEDFKQVRLNDGYVDERGNLWFGTMDRAAKHPKGALYFLQWMEGKPSIKIMDRDYVITNGPLISEQHKKLFHNHSNARLMYQFDIESSGGLTNKKIFAVIDKGHPDGMTIDEKDNIWVCLYGGHQVRVYSLEGKFVQSFEIPCPNVTKIAFGGKEYRTAFVTTAIKGLSPEEQSQYPQAGSLFSFQVETPGRKQNKFNVPCQINLKKQIF
ncbi:6-deoxy-6-sulfogluconolactonase [Commensalibacter sp. Nvir]|uniref:SMP-30/gluconolactonase/LRE family protein n=1 Tax=Commensalibacter sp. Nvir TaxID=3069817 RepID=UPI002D2C274A|nr:6-deoxy-6-sulfogluconolactonase [Commensalibacter sp. Nvir]